MIDTNLFTSDQIIQLELDLVQALTGQGLAPEEIRLIGVKGSGYHGTVFSVMIDGLHHVLKVYLEEKAFDRETKHLHQVIPSGRFLFVWRASENRFAYNIVIIEVPDGNEMRPATFTMDTTAVLAQRLVALHSLRSRRRVSAKSLKLRFEEVQPAAVAHATEYGDLISPSEVQEVIELAKQYLRENKDKFRVRKSRTHGDLWWSNIIVAAEDIYLVDWEWLQLADYCEDLAKMRILFNFVRRVEPITFFDAGSIQSDEIDAKMSIMLKIYRQHFSDPIIKSRYGFYCLLYGLLFFSDYYFTAKKGSIEGLNMLQDGIKIFRKYCVEQPATNA